jgi:aminoglycoside phosphotransferase family enzyme/predicted kinase
MSETSPEPAHQEAAFAFLGDPARFPHVERIDTHAAAVFLQGDRVLKVKRAIRIPFLDYSTLARRRLACEAEIRVNKPFAPEIYRRVVAITRDDDGTLSLGGTGTAIEYVVEMTRFDHHRTLDHLAQREALSNELVTRIADTIATSHARALEVATAPWVQSISAIIAGYVGAFRANSALPSTDIDDLEAASRKTLDRLLPLLDERGRRGDVRRCHGDLHLANIVMIGTTPVLFDAIEFDDIFYDLAFPLMDLLHYDQRSAANQLLNRYLAREGTDRADGLAALPLFMSMRAAVRSEVLLARAGQDDSKQTRTLEAANAYFELARRLIHPKPPVLTAVGGLSGTGKSVLARDLAHSVGPEPGAIVLRSDVIRKQLFGVAETERLPAEAYEVGTHDQVYSSLIEQAKRILSHGHAVILDAVFADERERSAAEAAARASHVNFTGLFLVADLATRRSRVGNRAADASDATPEVAEHQERYELGRMTWNSIDAGDTAATTLKRCLARLPPSHGTP